MAKVYVPKFEEKKYTAFPSPYGSHKSMIVEEATKRLNQVGKVVCKDTFGCYITESIHLDTGLADPHRNVSNEQRDGLLVQHGLGDLVKTKTKTSGNNA